MKKVIDTSVKVCNFEQLVQLIQWFETVGELGEYAYTLFGITVYDEQPSGNYYFLPEQSIWIERLADEDVAGTWIIYLDFSVPSFPVEHVFRQEDNQIELKYLLQQTTTKCVEQDTL